MTFRSANIAAGCMLTIVAVLGLIFFALLGIQGCASPELFHPYAYTNELVRPDGSPMPVPADVESDFTPLRGAVPVRASTRTPAAAPAPGPLETPAGFPVPAPAAGASGVAL